MSMTRRRKFTVAAVLFLGLAGVLLYRATSWAQYEGSVEKITLDLARPDVLIRTGSLSALPRDLLRVPVLRDVLTEDLVSYYEEHPDRIGIKGSIRRIAYEHKLTWTDEIVAWVFDQPAEVAFWRGPKGALDYWLIAMSRGTLAKVLEEAARVAANDRQLSRAAQVTVEGATVDVLALSDSGRTLLVAARGDRVIILSDPGMLLSEEREVIPAAQALVARLLSADEQQQAVYADNFHLTGPRLTHSIAARVHYLSFGYQRFFPGLSALRFDFATAGWTTQALFDAERLPPAALEDHELWRGVPVDPAACALLPVDWAQGSALASSSPAGRQATDLWQQFEGPAAICWYGKGRIHTPLVAALVKAPNPQLTPAFEALLAWGVSNPDETTPTVRKTADEWRWQRELEVPYAAIDADGRPEPGPLKVTFACKGRYVFFSPDAEQVERALATVGKRYPSLGDTLPAEGITLGFLNPKALAEIGRKEALVMLPRADEPVLRVAAESKLLPRLEALAQYPAYRLTLAARPASPARWEPVEWQELKP